MSGSLTSGGGENVPGIPGACVTHVSGKRPMAAQLSRKAALPLGNWLATASNCNGKNTASRTTRLHVILQNNLTHKGLMANIYPNNDTATLVMPLDVHLDVKHRFPWF